MRKWFKGVPTKPGLYLWKRTKVIKRPICMEMHYFDGKYFYYEGGRVSAPKGWLAGPIKVPA